MTDSTKSQDPVFELYMDSRVSHHSMRHKIGVACKNQNGDGLTLNIEGISMRIIALPVAEKASGSMELVATD